MQSASLRRENRTRFSGEPDPAITDDLIVWGMCKCQIWPIVTPHLYYGPHVDAIGRCDDCGEAISLLNYHISSRKEAIETFRANYRRSPKR